MSDNIQIVKGGYADFLQENVPGILGSHTVESGLFRVELLLSS